MIHKREAGKGQDMIRSGEEDQGVMPGCGAEACAG